MFDVVLNTLEKYWKDTTRGLQLKPFVVWFPFNLTSFFGQKFKKNLNSLEFKIFTQSFHPKLKLWSKSLGKTALWAAARTTRKQNSFWNILIGLGIMQRKVRIFEWEWRVIGYICTLCTTTILTNRPHMYTCTKNNNNVYNNHWGFHTCTVFKNYRKSLIQHCERRELWSHFDWTKVN